MHFNMIMIIFSTIFFGGITKSREEGFTRVIPHQGVSCRERFVHTNIQIYARFYYSWRLGLASKGQNMLLRLHAIIIGKQ